MGIQHINTDIRRMNQSESVFHRLLLCPKALDEAEPLGFSLQVKMKTVLVTIALVFSGFVHAENIEHEIRDLVELNLRVTQEEDMTAVLGTMHSQSPSYIPTKQVLPTIFASYNLKYELLSFKFIAYDGDLAYARIKQRTTGVTGANFQNNVLDIVQIFRQQNGTWKIWAQANIEIKYIQ